ncbi:MAG: pyrroline-5-carboxylate reductase [Gammaproteobacteria bacterium]|jgi:pyrroline-5-carboxylate reductase
MKQARISFLGCGNMGRSLIGGLIGNGYPVELLCGADPDAEQREQLARLFGISVFADNNEAIQKAEVVVLAVKPQAINSTVRELANSLNKQKPLLLSIAAGVRLSAIRSSAGSDVPIVRVMPNTPALIGCGAAAMFANEKVSAEHRDLAEAIMRSVGIAIWLDDEAKLDAVTALSGSGPAYFFLVMELMEKAAIELGLNEEQARLLTLETALGAAKMASESVHAPGVLRQQVTSPGGTTERALQVLLEGDIERLFGDALKAAKNRSIELADKFGNN